MPLPSFHPVIAEWFSQRFATPTEPQRLGWPTICEQRDTLIAAPTGSGKTLTAFLASLDRLLRLALAGEKLGNGMGSRLEFDHKLYPQEAADRFAGTH